ncbi:erythrocyte binding protein [Reticulomyxa filosa]|uniref:Erythrocyte binding protein n=1 Tax=Reticulomyxa filosa TaxID=46433 RepID=X6NBT6_RETFI|nr:erythrocyte binding protein [Reticulomyxa filosa]|eukprot:ETO23760.1 erythrocyte binding protein [Reticulomyxa filosa]
MAVTEESWRSAERSAKEAFVLQNENEQLKLNLFAASSQIETLTKDLGQLKKKKKSEIFSIRHVISMRGFKKKKKYDMKMGTAEAKSKCKEKEEKIKQLEEEIAIMKELDNGELVELQKKVASYELQLSEQKWDTKEMNKEKSKMEQYNREMQQLQNGISEAMKTASSSSSSSSSDLQSTKSNRSTSSEKMDDGTWKKQVL